MSISYVMFFPQVRSNYCWIVPNPCRSMGSEC